MAYPVDLETQPGDKFTTLNSGAHDQLVFRGPYVNVAGDRYIFGSPIPTPVAHTVNAYRSQDKGLTWQIQDGAHNVTGFQGWSAVAKHPTNASLVTVFYVQSQPTFGSQADPYVINAQDFNIDTGLWSGAAYGGTFPFVPTLGAGWIDPALIAVITRPTASEFVVLAYDTTGVGQTRSQFVRLSPGGAWSASIDAFPGGPATDLLVIGFGLFALACTADGHIYGLLSRTGLVDDTLVQSILSPVNVVTNVQIDLNITNPAGNYAGGSAGYIAASNKIFLLLDFIPTVGNKFAYGGFAVQGGDITHPYNLGVAGVVNPDANRTALSATQGLVQFWYTDHTNAPFFSTLDPTLVAPVVGPLVSSITVFPSIVVPTEVHDVTSIGAYGIKTGSFDAEYWEFAGGGGGGTITQMLQPANFLALPEPCRLFELDKQNCVLYYLDQVYIVD